MRAEINIAMIAIGFVALQGIVNWMGPDGYRDFMAFMFGDFVAFWHKYRYQLTPDFSQPAEPERRNRKVTKEATFTP